MKKDNKKIYIFLFMITPFVYLTTGTALIVHLSIAHHQNFKHNHHNPNHCPKQNESKNCHICQDISQLCSSITVHTDIHITPQAIIITELVKRFSSPYQSEKRPFSQRPPPEHG